MQSVMLASEFKPENASYPYLATPKIDGIRFYLNAGHCWSRSNKPIPNINIQLALRRHLAEGMDGELFVDDFNSSSSLVMSDLKPLDSSSLKVFIFDLFSPEKTYLDRILSLQQAFKALKRQGWTGDSFTGLNHDNEHFTLFPLYPVWIKSAKSFRTYYEQCIEAGHEGICLRDPRNLYTFNRSKTLLKYKEYDFREARILGFEEQLRNENEQFTDELGHSKRSKAADGLVPSGILGAFTVRDCQNEVMFSVGAGPGLTHLLRAQLWADRYSLTGKIIRYRCFPYGEKEKPRQPQFLGFRDERDM